MNLGYRRIKPNGRIKKEFITKILLKVKRGEVESEPFEGSEFLRYVSVEDEYVKYRRAHVIFDSRELDSYPIHKACRASGYDYDMLSIRRKVKIAIEIGLKGFIVLAIALSILYLIFL
jgi:hypothetical protein